MLLLALALAQDLAEIEVARGEKPKAKCLFQLDDDRYELDEAWGEGKSPLLPKPATSFGSMNRERACAWTLEVVRASFEGEWSDLTRPANGPDTVDKGDGKPMPVGWGLDFLQTYKGAAFCDPDEPGERAGVIARLSDDLSGLPEGSVTARVSVKRWAVLKEHGPAKKVVKEDAATAAALKDFAKTYPKLRGKKCETEAVLFWAVKPGAADRRIPLWHVTAKCSDGERKPTIHAYRVDAWKGTIVSSREEAIPGLAPPTPPPPPEK
ncbi:MAG TPA: hypothetical protein VF950_09770 [Planctomycetota bacterium]